MDEKDYLMALKDVLKRKYSLSGEDAADMILSSYIISLIVLYPEETLHDDIEVHADNIYEDHQASKKTKTERLLLEAGYEGTIFFTNPSYEDAFLGISSDDRAIEDYKMKYYNGYFKELKNEIVQWIRDWFDQNCPGCNAIVGISGGKDSSVVAALCAEALGKDRVIGVLMPQGQQKDIYAAYKLCEFLDIKSYEINIGDTVRSVLSRLESSGIEISEQTKINLPARIRMSTLYAVSQSCNGRVANTCNLYALSDLTDENDITPDWGRYLLQNADRYIYKNPDVMIYGNDDSRSGWFDKKDLKNTTELIINREELPISGTMLRALMIQDKRREWMTFVNPKLHKMYDEIRSELMESIKEN